MNFQSFLVGVRAASSNIGQPGTKGIMGRGVGNGYAILTRITQVVEDNKAAGSDRALDDIVGWTEVRFVNLYAKAICQELVQDDPPVRTGNRVKSCDPDHRSTVVNKILDGVPICEIRLFRLKMNRNVVVIKEIRGFNGVWIWRKIDAVKACGICINCCIIFLST